LDTGPFEHSTSICPTFKWFQYSDFSVIVNFTIYVLYFVGGAIPDAAAIHAARKQRQAARDGGAGPGSASYMPIKKKGSEQNSAGTT
jgi:hypothetical protein